MSLVEQTKAVLKKCDAIQQSHQCFRQILHTRAMEQAMSLEGKNLPLKGLFVTVKDNISVSEGRSHAGSAILDGYEALYNATAVQRLEENGAIVVGITTMDEFGFGSWGTNTGNDIPIPKHPTDASLVAGGSSSGSGVIAALADFTHVALAESTGGSIETPAAISGVIGFCPTYGRISRHGLISYADSLDKIGFMTKTADELLPVLEVTQGVDNRDGTSLQASMLEMKQGPYTVGVASYEEIDPEIAKQFSQTVEKLKAAGHTIKEIALPFTEKYAVATYYVLAMCEASTNLAMYSGLRYGVQESAEGKNLQEYFTEIRTKNFGPEAKRRIILGTYMRSAGYRDQYYLKAAKVRRKIIEEYEKQFENCDVIISPTLPVQTPTVEQAQSEDPATTYGADRFTVGPNLAGIPHASIPAGESNMLASTAHNDEYTLIAFLKEVEGL